MTLNIEKEYERKLDVDFEAVARAVAELILEEEHCPYEAQVNILLTSDKGIREINRICREIDSATDVLSFPALVYKRPADYSWAEENEADCFDPESGELMLGDIVVSLDKVEEQAEKYGHSEKREYAFLIAHSMLHLCGYDHETEDERAAMEGRQSEILNALNIRREDRHEQ